MKREGRKGWNRERRKGREDGKRGREEEKNREGG